VNKYDRINQPLSKEFGKLLTHFMAKAENDEEEKIMIQMAREVWNISYFDNEAQQNEIAKFIHRLEVDDVTSKRYRNLMINGIKNKKNATKGIDLENVWTRIEELDVQKIGGKYKIEFKFDFYQ